MSTTLEVECDQVEFYTTATTGQKYKVKIKGAFTVKVKQEEWWENGFELSDFIVHDDKPLRLAVRGIIVPPYTITALDPTDN